MPKKNTFLPLLQYRNQRKKQQLKNSLKSITQNPSLKSIKRYQSIFDDDSFKFIKLMQKKDEETASLIQKYFSKYERKKQKKKKYQISNQKDSKTLNLINLSKSLDLKIKNKPKLIKISQLSKSIVEQDFQQKSQRIFRPKKEKIKQITQEQPEKKINFLRFPIRIFDDPFRSRQQLLSRYGVLKTEVSRSLQNDLKVQNYNWKNSKNSYLQKILRNFESKQPVYQQKSQRFKSQAKQDDKESKNINFKIKTQDFQKSQKSQIKYKKYGKNINDKPLKLKRKIPKQSLYDINPWLNDTNQIELRDTMR